MAFTQALGRLINNNMNLEETTLDRNISAPLELPDSRAIAEIRLILTLATLVAVGFMLPLTGRYALIYGVIAAYIVSALVLYWVVLNRPAVVREGLVYWLDAGWMLAIIALADKPGSPLFLLLLFPVMVAAAQAGFVQGMAVSVGTSVAYVLLSGLLADGVQFRPELILQAGILLVQGFMISRWAGAEGYLKRKLTMLNRLGRLTGLRDEDEPFWTDTLSELAAYFGARSALFLALEEDGSQRIYEYEAGKHVWSMALRDEQAAMLGGVPETWAVVWRSWFRNPRFGTAKVVDMHGGQALEGMEGRLQALAHTLEAQRWMSFPLHAGSRYRGRIFLVGIERFKCKLDWGFIQQLARQISLKWDNLLLARRLTRVAACGERERISRDLHDSTVQPYLGLKYGLEALRRKVADDHALAPDIDELVRMTDNSILQLRGYIRDLRTTDADGAHSALTMIQAQVQQFEDYSGLKVEVRASDFELGESSLLEVRQLIAEGLSNIRRHTRARQATLEVRVEGGGLRIAFINPVARVVPPFKPRSLTERAAAMGGTVETMRLATETIVRIELPLWRGEKK